MKKKFSMVLAGIMLVCTLAIALVACAPKDPDPYDAVSNSEVLEQLWDAWAADNMNLNGNTLGIDANLGLKNSETDLSIALQGGISQDKNVKEVLRLAIANNKKTGNNKNIIDVIINTDALFINIDGFSSKPIKISELQLPSIGDLIGSAGMSISSLLPIIKPAIISLIDFSIQSGTKVVIDPVKNGKTYDVKYTFSLAVDQLVDAVLDLLSSVDIPDTVTGVIDSVKDMVDGINLDITVNTTGNTQEKVKKPAKGAPKYNYVGGKFAGVDIAVEGMKVDANGVKFGNSIPNISVPTDTMDLDTALLTSRINGNINLRDANGNVTSHYTYTINLDFTPIQLITTISDCVASGSATPILNKMFKDQQGKIFIEVNHTCGETCQTKHVGGKKMDGSIIAIAYSPEEFGNNRVYVSLDLQTIINDSLLQDAVGISLNSIFPAYYTQFSFDFLEYLDLLDLRAANATPSEPGETTPGGDSITPDTGNTTLPVDKIVSAIGNMIPNVINGFKTNQELQIGLADIGAILQSLQDSMDAGTYWTIRKAVYSLFGGDLSTDPYDDKGVKLCLDVTSIKNGEDYEMNVLDLYKRQNATTLKDFGGTSVANGNVIKGKPTYELDSNGNVKIYTSASNSVEPVPTNLLYNESGKVLPIAYDEVMSLVDSSASGKGGKIKFTFTDLFGNEITTFMKITEIVGLDPTIVGEPQEVALVLYNSNAGYSGNGITAAGIGSNINNVVKNTLLGIAVPALKTISTPELVVKTKITLDTIKGVQFKQADGNANNINTEKTYDMGDEININFDVYYTYNNSTDVKYASTVAPTNSSNFIATDKDTKKTTIKVSHDFTLNYKYIEDTHSIKVKVKQSTNFASALYTKTMSNGKATIDISTMVTNNLVGNTSEYIDTETIETYVAAFNAKYDESVASATIVKNKDVYSKTTFTFNQAGIYEFEAYLQTSPVKVKFAIIEAAKYLIEEKADAANKQVIYAGMTKSYDTGKIGAYTFSYDELAKAVEDFNKLYEVKGEKKAVATLSGDKTTPKLDIKFNANGTYYLNVKDVDGKYVTITYKPSSATKDIKKYDSTNALKLLVDNKININSTLGYTDITYTDEALNTAVSAFNTTYQGHATMSWTWLVDEKTQAKSVQITINAKHTNVTNEVQGIDTSKYILNLVGTRNETVKFTFAFENKVVDKSTNTNTSTWVTGDTYTISFADIETATGYTIDKEKLQKIATDDKNSYIKLEIVTGEDGKDAIKFTAKKKGYSAQTIEIIPNRVSIKLGHPKA